MGYRPLNSNFIHVEWSLGLYPITFSPLAISFPLLSTHQSSILTMARGQNGPGTDSSLTLFPVEPQWLHNYAEEGALLSSSLGDEHDCPKGPQLKWQEESDAVCCKYCSIHRGEVVIEYVANKYSAPLGRIFSPT